MFSQEQVTSFTNSIDSRISADTSRVTTASDILNEHNPGLVKEYSQGESISIDYRPMENTSAGSSFAVGSDSFMEQQSGKLYIPPEDSFATIHDDKSENNQIFDRSQSSAGVDQLIPGSILVNDRGEIYESSAINRIPIRPNIVSSENVNEDPNQSSIYLPPTAMQQNQAISSENQQLSQSSFLSVETQETQAKGNITNIESNASIPLINAGYNNNKQQGLSPHSENSVGNVTISIVSGSLASSASPSVNSPVWDTSPASRNPEVSSVKSQLTNETVQSSHSVLNSARIQPPVSGTNDHTETDSETTLKSDMAENTDGNSVVNGYNTVKNIVFSKPPTPRYDLTDDRVKTTNTSTESIDSRKSTISKSESSKSSGTSKNASPPNTPQIPDAEDSTSRNKHERKSSTASSSISSKPSSKEKSKIRSVSSSSSIVSKNTRPNSKLTNNKALKQTPIDFDAVLSRLYQDNNVYPILLSGAYDTVLREGEVLPFLPTPAYYHRVFPLGPRPIVLSKEDLTNEDAKKHGNNYQKLIESSDRSKQNSPALEIGRRASQSSQTKPTVTRSQNIKDGRRSSSSARPLKLTQFDLDSINDALELFSKHPERIKIVDAVSPTLEEPSLKTESDSRPPSAKNAVTDLKSPTANRQENLPTVSLASVPKASQSPVVPPPGGLFASLFGGAGTGTNSSAQPTIPTTDVKPTGSNNDINSITAQAATSSNVTYYSARALPDELLKTGSFISPSNSLQINSLSSPSKSNVQDPLESIVNKNATMLRTNQNPFDSTSRSKYESVQKSSDDNIHYLRRRRYTAPLDDYERLIDLLIRKTSITLI